MFRSISVSDRMRERIKILVAKYHFRTYNDMFEFLFLKNKSEVSQILKENLLKYSDNKQPKTPNKDKSDNEQKTNVPDEGNYNVVSVNKEMFDEL